MDEGQPSPLAAAARWLRRRLRPARDGTTPAERLYAQIVAHARTPTFYRDLGVPDIPEGRFEMVALHAAMVMRRLRSEGDEGRALSQATFDLMFADIDESLRHIGIGDLSVGRYVKRLAGNFYARLAALDRALDGDEQAALHRIMTRNVYHGGAPPAAAQLEALAAYLVTTERALGAQEGATLVAGEVVFPAPEPPA